MGGDMIAFISESTRLVTVLFYTHANEVWEGVYRCHSVGQALVYSYIIKFNNLWEIYFRILYALGKKLHTWNDMQ